MSTSVGEKPSRGDALESHSCLELFVDHSTPNAATCIWDRRGRSARLGAARSAVSLSSGDVVEECCAFALDTSEFDGTFLLEHCCYDVQDANHPVVALLPLGLSAFYSSPPAGTDANSIACHEVDARGRHWLKFRATRHITTGEELTANHGPIKNQGKPRWVDIDMFGNDCSHAVLTPDKALAWLHQRFQPRTHGSRRGCGFSAWVSRYRSWLHSRRALKLLRQPMCGLVTGSRVVVAPSDVDGYGVFAKMDMDRGSVVDVAPVVVVQCRETRGVLARYAFEGPSGDLARLPFGPSLLLNHSGTAHNVAWRLPPGPAASSGTVLLWVALRFIRAGEELLHDYGAGYWRDDISAPAEPASLHLARPSSVGCGNCFATLIARDSQR